MRFSILYYGMYFIYILDQYQITTYVNIITILQEKKPVIIEEHIVLKLMYV